MDCERNNVILNIQTWQSLVIKKFPLPENWKQYNSTLMIILPERSQLFYSPPDRFYLDWGLKAINGLTPEHYFENHSFNDFSKHRIARFSFHVQSGWVPAMNCTKGSNLLHVLDGLYKGMYTGAKEVL